ncbi:MAG: molybdopterin-dependent oxidoreductase [Eubacteriales bacterium]|nr:molybdopterin-dependent oxidoreductase [Eubacteriales bacterium]
MIDQKHFSVIGRHSERVDGQAKVSGSARFTVDMHLAGMLYMKVLRSPYAHARVKSVYTKEAEAMQGVAGVFTHLDLTGIRVHNDRLDDRVRFLGEAVAAVAAVREDVASEALELIHVEYEELPAVLNAREAVKPKAPAVWHTGNVASWRGPKTSEKGCSDFWEKGDVEQALEEAAVVAETEFHTHAQYHVCLEPHACVMNWEDGLGQMTAYISTQAIYQDQVNLARALKLPIEKVQVKCPFVGGGFGSKAENTCKEYYMAAFMAKRLRRPVKYVPERSEETVTALRHPADFMYKVGASEDGRITAIDMKVLRSGGSHTSLQMNFLAGSTDYVVPTYVKSPNARYEGWSVYDNLPLCAAFRGFGYFESGTALAQALDMTAEKLGMDPVEFLIRNIPERGDPVGANQVPLTTAGIADVVRKCAECMEWKKKWHQPGERRLPDGRMHGIAVAHAMGRSTLPEFVVTGNASIELREDGTALVMAGVTDIGQGQATGLAQIAAEAMGLNIEAIHVLWGDTIAPITGHQVASSTTMMTGNAVRLAGQDVKRQILDYAVPVLEVKSAEELEIENSLIYVKENPKKQLPVAQIVNMPCVKTILGRGNWCLPEAKCSPRTIMVCIAEVAVDVETGKIEVTDMIQGTECGQMISPARVEGQIQAVLSGGMGYALMENWAMDTSRGGMILNTNMLDYKIPTFADTGNILRESIVLENPDPEGPFGARGMGEASLSASAPAILNAVYNAIGVRFREMPLTPARVLKGLEKVTI